MTILQRPKLSNFTVKFLFQEHLVRGGAGLEFMGSDKFVEANTFNGLKVIVSHPVGLASVS